MKDDSVYLRHILECIARIKEYTSGGRAEYLNSAIVQDAVLRNLQIMTESTQRLSDDAKGHHLEVEWKLISAFRNVLVHSYLGIDLEQVWNTVEQDLPALEAAAQSLLGETR